MLCVPRTANDDETPLGVMPLSSCSIKEPWLPTEWVRKSFVSSTWRLFKWIRGVCRMKMCSRGTRKLFFSLFPRTSNPRLHCFLISIFIAIQPSTEALTSKRPRVPQSSLHASPACAIRREWKDKNCLWSFSSHPTTTIIVLFTASEIRLATQTHFMTNVTQLRRASESEWDEIRISSYFCVRPSAGETRKIAANMNRLIFSVCEKWVAYVLWLLMPPCVHLVPLVEWVVDVFSSAFQYA